ncbi:MAG: LacI family transcriptional regulator, partial [Lactobacillus sp.]|nr:LacI family transcriptional regulator [Lactobacillus sp.]
PYVHPNTKKRILDVAKMLSYDPKLLRKAIEKGKTRTIGIIVPNLQYSIFMDFVQKAEKNANAVDYKIIIGISDDDPEKEMDLLERMRFSLVDGILITSAGKNNNLLEDVDVSGTPIIQVFRNVDTHLNSVSINYKQSVNIAVNKLLNNGAKTIGLINGFIQDESYLEKLDAFKKKMKQLKKPSLAKNLNEYPKSFNEAGYDLTAELMTENPEIDGLLVSNDTQALGSMQYLIDQGFKIPEDIKIISLAGCSMSDLSQTQISATNFPIESISMRSLSLLISKIEKLENITVKHEILNTKFVSRKTC